jgi:hypothetical protein
MGPVGGRWGTQDSGIGESIYLITIVLRLGLLCAPSGFQVQAELNRMPRAFAKWYLGYYC